VGESLRTRQC